MTAAGDFRLLDTTFRIVARSDSVLRDINRLLGPFRSEPGAEVEPVEVQIEVAGDHILLLGGTEVARGPTATSLLDHLVAHLNRRAIEGYGGFAVHAGAVALNGRVLAFPAGSGGGKSTFTAACLLSGCSYVSDEALCLGRSGLEVVPYPKPLALDADSRSVLGLGDTEAGERLFSAEELGAHVAQGPLTLHGVVLLRRIEGPAQLAPLPSSEAMAALLRFSFTHYKDPERHFRVAAELARRSRTWRLDYEDPRRAAAVLVEQVWSQERGREDRQSFSERPSGSLSS